MNWTAAVIFALIAAGLAAWQFPAANPRQARRLCPGERAGHPGVPRLAACSRTGALALVARHYGLTMNGITLWLFGGASGLGEAPSPAAEARIADRWRGVRAGQIMAPGPATMPGSMTVTEFFADYFYRTRHQGFPV